MSHFALPVARLPWCVLWLVLSVGGSPLAWADESPAATPAKSECVLRIHAGRPAAHPISKYITGKFCEHLGNNIYNGMTAQVLRNPTFADVSFGAGHNTPDGVVAFQCDPERIAQQIRQQAKRYGWPDAEVDRLVESRADALACWWTRVGTRQAVTPSADVGPHGGRAQRVEVAAAGEGIAQWTWLPMHRTRKYEYEITARSPDSMRLTLSLSADNAAPPIVQADIGALSPQWKTYRGALEIDAQSPADAAYRLALTTAGAGQFVIARALLQPADHVAGADPDVVRWLKESRLPILRWPGGNFVSGYHWQDGVGPTLARPTRPNYAWGGIETNLFGTDEFMAFCRAVGCEPMICVNAGNGTPDEAARWIEYCNGPADSPMGRLRAANGHPEPYGVHHWEVGNELWGKFQVHWTTPEGNLDRYNQFSRAMRAADPSITLYACGTSVLKNDKWNATLIRGAAGSLETIADHALIGGPLPPATDPLHVFSDFMVVPDVLAKKWAGLQREMLAAGVRKPALAITELQLFASIAPTVGDDARLTKENLVSPPTLAEALYDVLVYHRAIELSPFVNVITHSATVNHGGGLRKERERVFVNPCHWAQAGFAALAGARPVAVETTSPEQAVPRVLPALKNQTEPRQYATIDALAATGKDEMWLSIVHRGTSGPTRVAIEIDGFSAGPKAELYILSADAPWAANTLAAPNAVRPQESTVDVRDNKLSLELKSYTWARVRIAARQQAR